MNRVLLHFVGLLGVALVLIAVIFGAKQGALAAFVAGEGVFAGEVVLLAWVGARVLAGGGEPAGGRTWLLGLGLIGKVFLGGVGVYVALVLLGLRADFFVGGLVSGLAGFVGAAAMNFSNFSLSTGAKVS